MQTIKEVIVNNENFDTSNGKSLRGAGRNTP